LPQIHASSGSPQLVVIIKMFVAEYQSMNPLSGQLHRCVRQALVTVVDKPVGKNH
jgi:hypothetical protein